LIIVSGVGQENVGEKNKGRHFLSDGRNDDQRFSGGSEFIVCKKLMKDGEIGSAF